MAVAEHLRIAGVVCLYFVVSITLVFANKILMPSGEDKQNNDIDAPLFVTWFQCVLTAVIIWTLGTVAQGAAPDSWLKEFPKVELNPKVAVSVAPLSLMFLGMITFNNLCLKFVSVPFYNVARSLTIVTNVIFTFFLLGERTSLRVCLTLLVVIVGFYVGIEGELRFSLIGTLFGVASSCFVSLNAIYTKKTMPLVDGDKWKLAWYNNVNAALGFLPLIFVAGEQHELVRQAHVLTSAYYWLVMSVAGVLGFAIGIVTVMQINYTSPLTHNISGTVKACVQTILAILIFQSAWTGKGLFGIFLTIFGSLLYTLVKMRENDAKQQQQQQLLAAPPSLGYQLVPKQDGAQHDEDEDALDHVLERGHVNGAASSAAMSSSGSNKM